MNRGSTQDVVGSETGLQSLDEIFLEIGQSRKAVSPVPVLIPPQVSPAAAVDPPRRISVERGCSQAPEPDPFDVRDSSEGSSRFFIVASLLVVGLFVIKGAFGWASHPQQPRENGIRPAVVQSTVERTLRTRAIEDFDVGMRALGKNPLREHGLPEVAEPDPENCRKLVLRMSKSGGGQLLIHLLREVEWIDDYEVTVGGTFHLDLPEMGAVGDAQVDAILPSPPFEEGPGNLVTGTFAHEADPDTRLLSVRFANGTVVNGVTDNHPFYSVDRKAFVPVGEMREGDRVNVDQGVTRISRVESRPVRSGTMLYNLETFGEHVYRVGAEGVLVHNNCLGNNMKATGSYGDLGTDAHHIVALTHRRAAPARNVLSDHGISIDDAMNGVWLPRTSTASRARGALHRESGSALTNRTYIDEVNRRIVAADAAGGRAHVLRELQKIRMDLLDGVFPGVRPNF